ncbi:hypothetical protein GGX14DRAFT_588260 [Mycena pura]|uniref:Uncharacterized protein n=1 Tax=Mycena pura TaxID=153505 RepID=A0AAD6Y2L5_9AGAR|nr:hypothetical protein GGX14DRAFT_588260 [Mycena pura]
MRGRINKQRNPGRLLRNVADQLFLPTKRAALIASRSTTYAGWIRYRPRRPRKPLRRGAAMRTARTAFVEYEEGLRIELWRRACTQNPPARVDAASNAAAPPSVVRMLEGGASHFLGGCRCGSRGRGGGSDGVRQRSATQRAPAGSISLVRFLERARVFVQLLTPGAPLTQEAYSSVPRSFPHPPAFRPLHAPPSLEPHVHDDCELAAPPSLPQHTCTPPHSHRYPLRTRTPSIHLVFSVRRFPTRLTPSRAARARPQHMRTPARRRRTWTARSPAWKVELSSLSSTTTRARRNQLEERLRICLPRPTTPPPSSPRARLRPVSRYARVLMRRRLGDSHGGARRAAVRLHSLRTGRRQRRGLERGRGEGGGTRLWCEMSREGGRWVVENQERVPVPWRREGGQQTDAEEGRKEAEGEEPHE